MSRLSMDLKVMPKSQKGHRYILCVIDEVTNFLIMVPIFQARSEEVREAFLEHVVTKHCIPDYIIMDQDSVFMSSLMTYLFHRLNINNSPLQSSITPGRAQYQVPYMHSNQTSPDLGQMWTKYLSLATFAYNTFNSPNLGNYSPFELTFGRKPKLLLNTETNPDIKVLKNLKEYYNLLNKRSKYLQDILFNFKSQRLAMINQNRENFQYRGKILFISYHP